MSNSLFENAEQSKEGRFAKILSNPRNIVIAIFLIGTISYSVYYVVSTMIVASKEATGKAIIADRNLFSGEVSKALSDSQEKIRNPLQDNSSKFYSNIIVH